MENESAREEESNKIKLRGVSPSHGRIPDSHRTKTHEDGQIRSAFERNLLANFPDLKFKIIGSFWILKTLDSQKFNFLFLNFQNL